jgi:H+/gluconate symporter-like permease
MRLAILIIASLAAALRVYFALSDGTLLSLGFSIWIAVDLLFFVAALGLYLNRPIVGHTFWRIVFLVLGSITAVALGVAAAYAFLGVLSDLGMDGWAISWLVGGVITHFLLMFGMWLYVYRSQAIWWPAAVRKVSTGALA